MSVGVLSTCLCDGIRSFGTGVADSCKLLCGCWELDLWKGTVFLTTEPSL